MEPTISYELAVNGKEGFKICILLLDPDKRGMASWRGFYPVMKSAVLPACLSVPGQIAAVPRGNSHQDKLESFVFHSFGGNINSSRYLSRALCSHFFLYGRTRDFFKRLSSLYG